MQQLELKNKKILLVGLGILGGGVATARFLLRRGVKLSITDKRDKKTLQGSIQKLPKGILYRIGIHTKEDFKKADIIVANPAVPRYGEWIAYAEKLGKPIFNDYTLFLNLLSEKNREYIAITGTRGKTTSSLWIHHFLDNSVLGGNIPEKPLLKILSERGNPFVLETSSFQLEYVRKGLLAPKVALITNLYQDHLNRHETMKEYVRVKGNIFLNQKNTDFLVLNFENPYTKEFLKLKPKSQVFYVSTRVLPKTKNGIFVSQSKIYFQNNRKKVFVVQSPFDTDFENHNLLGAMLVSFLYTGGWKKIISKMKNLPQAHMRREVIMKKKNLVVVNDSAGTSPDATIALLSSYKKIPKHERILITGGTDKQLDFGLWAKVISDSIAPENLFLLEGSATKKMILELNKLHYWRKGSIVTEFSSLKDILTVVQKRKTKRVVLFSPGSASFEKFKNEFDRGKQFVTLIKKTLLK